jgi:23S rRNA pseudouridine1911/1915/1917 synthase
MTDPSDTRGGETHRFQAPDDAARDRLDRFLAARLPAISRSRISAVIRGAGALVDGQMVSDPARKVGPGALVELTIPPVVEAVPTAQAMALDVIFEDEALIVIDKPAGLVVHPAAGNPDRTLVNALLAHCGPSLSGIGGVRRPGIVHRLDKDTSGLMVAAKTDEAHHSLAAQFSGRTIERAYRAVAWGVPNPPRGAVEGNIGRSPVNRKKMAVVGRGGRHARTHYAVESVLAGGAASLLQCRLETGRTHQIRVHMTHIGHPLVGDPVYGRGKKRGACPAPEAAKSFPRQALHAYLLGFTHPLSRAEISFESDLPRDIKQLLDDMGEAGDAP